MRQSVRHNGIVLSLNQHEVGPLQAARETGWLTLTREVNDQAVALWQHECEREGRPLAMVRQETRRVSIWFFLAAGREWTRAERELLDLALAGIRNCIVTCNSVRGFAEPGTEAALMRKLLAATAH
jgi:hypothetical protein